MLFPAPFQKRDALRIPLIMHIDADAFFVSCEQALNPGLKNKPVVTGAERGIVTALSYEAKSMGIRRGQTIYSIKKFYKDVIVCNGNLKTYENFSRRLFRIIGQHCDTVEQYSIDECFADISYYKESDIKKKAACALCIKKEIEQFLDISVSVGLAPTKVLAKIASKKNKPSGFVCITPKNIIPILQETPIESLWGIGKSTAKQLQKQGIHRAFDFKQKSFSDIQHFKKPLREIWWELQGYSIFHVQSNTTQKHQSLRSSQTFTPPTDNTKEIFIHLTKNLETACYRLRKYGKIAKKVSLFLKTQNFAYHTNEYTFQRASSSPQYFLPEIERLFFKTIQPHTEYRTTGITFFQISDKKKQQQELSKQPIDKFSSIEIAKDALYHKFKKQVLFWGNTYKKTSPLTKQKTTIQINNIQTTYGKKNDTQKAH